VQRLPCVPYTPASAFPDTVAVDADVRAARCVFREPREGFAMLKGVLTALLKLGRDPLIKVKGLGFTRANARVWDAEYELGNWEYLDTQDNGRTPVAMLEKYALHGRLLDLGCGTSRNLPLNPDNYAQYHGVDISSEAIRQARALGRPNSSFETGDILTYHTDEKYDAVLLREVLYYLPRKEVPGLLERVATLLTPGGVAVIQIWNTVKFGWLLTMVRECSLTVREEIAEGEFGACTVVLGAPE
jgi:SAM-dependent methyltransferase